MEQELLTLPDHLSSPPDFSGVRVIQSLVLCVCFVDHCLSFCTFSFGHCVVCSSSIYRFWLSLWYFQTLHTLHISTVSVIVVQWLACSFLNAIDSRFEPMFGQTKHHTIGIWCRSAKHAVLMNKRKDRLVRNQNNVYERNDMSSTDCWFSR